MSQAVAESREASWRLKGMWSTAHDECQQAIVETCQAIADPNPPTISPASASNVDLGAVLHDLRTLNDNELSHFNEALMAILASTVINADCPNDPATLKEALDSPDSTSWHASIPDELKSLQDMGIYKLISCSSVPASCKILYGKWVFRLKCDEAGHPAWFKFCLVVKGFKQVFGQDYIETTSPTPCMKSLHLILHIATVNDWEVQQIDVKTAYLYSLLPANEVVYMEKPEGFEESGQEDYIWELQPRLYGMKQSGHIWNRTMHKAMISWGFKHLSADACVYYRQDKNSIILTTVYC